MNLRKGPKVALLPSLLCMQRNTLGLHFVAGATEYPGMLGLVPAIYGVCIYYSIPNQGADYAPTPPDRLIPTNFLTFRRSLFLKSHDVLAPFCFTRPHCTVAFWTFTFHEKSGCV